MSPPAPTSEQPQPRGGRPRDPGIDRAVLDATVELLREQGYGGLTIAAVAERAGTTKPAVYRRWRTAQRLAIDALAEAVDGREPRDTGCTICDLAGALKLHAAAVRRVPPRVLAPLLADCAGDPELYDALMRALFEPPRRAVAAILERAIARGDLRADVDRRLVVDHLGALVHYRALFGHAPTSDREIERAVHLLLRGIATDYPRLLAATEHDHAAPAPAR